MFDEYALREPFQANVFALLLLGSRLVVLAGYEERSFKK